MCEKVNVSVVERARGPRRDDLYATTAFLTVCSTRSLSETLICNWGYEWTDGDHVNIVGEVQECWWKIRRGRSFSIVHCVAHTQLVIATELWCEMHWARQLVN